MIKFSVIIPAFNAAATIERAIESVLAQSHPAHEIIVVDDGSTDESMRLISPYRQRIRVINQRNAGVSVARNRGVAVATGDWLAFLDADDVFFPDRLNAHAAWIAEWPEVDFLLGDQEARDPSGKVLRTFINTTLAGRALAGRDDQSERQVLGVADFDDLIADGYMEIRTVSIAKRRFNMLGGFPVEHRIGEDMHLFIRLLAGSTSGGVVMKPLAAYYIYPGSALRRDPVAAQQNLEACMTSLNSLLTTAPSSVRRGYTRRCRSVRLELAYARLRAGQRMSAVCGVAAEFVRRPSIPAMLDVLSIARGFRR